MDGGESFDTRRLLVKLGALRKTTDSVRRIVKAVLGVLSGAGIALGVLRGLVNGDVLELRKPQLISDAGGSWKLAGNK